jgi:peptidoglycan LD-endopeptidase CwlK
MLSDMRQHFASLKEALAGSDAPTEVLATLALCDLKYIDFKGNECTGQVVIHADLADEVQDLFTELHRKRFPIQSIVPVIAYDWDDEASMIENNSSAFNYRKILGTDKLSNHSLGRALDINPVQNPYYAKDGKVYPLDAVYDPMIPGTITPDIADLFKKRGWVWLGDREENTDYQHFEKHLDRSI